jgi:hypothetical protein
VVRLAYTNVRSGCGVGFWVPKRTPGCERARSIGGNASLMWSQKVTLWHDTILRTRSTRDDHANHRRLLGIGGARQRDSEA